MALSLKISVTDLVSHQKELRDNMLCDLKSDWIEEEDRIELQLHLQLLNQSIASLESILASSHDRSQIFNNINR